VTDSKRPSSASAGTNPRRGGNLVLIGYRGCGKTTVGRIVAQRLAWTFVDTDELIEHAAGRNIARIFAENGEPAFRELEAVAVQQAIRGTRHVVSVGGGAVLREENRLHIGAGGFCVWLTAPAEELHRRLVADPRSSAQRPALTAQPGLDEIKNLLAKRTPLYEAVAHRIVDTTGRALDDVVNDVLDSIPEELRTAAP